MPSWGAYEASIVKIFISVEKKQNIGKACGKKTKKRSLQINKDLDILIMDTGQKVRCKWQFCSMGAG